MSIDYLDEVAIPGTFNVRDIGAYYKASPILPHKLLRTALLSHLTNDGKDKILELGVDVVVDLRSAEEIDRDGADRLPKGIERVFLPIDTAVEENISADVSKILDEAKKTNNPIEKQIFIMRAFYKKFVSVKRIRLIFGEVLEVLANYKYPLFHCTAGKDRTGWTAVLCHNIAGTSQDTIIDDYLLSNKSAKDLWKTIPFHNRDSFEEQKPALGVDITYLQSALEEVSVIYGSIDNYIGDLGISSSTIEQLKKRITQE
ncbi:MAG: tyrosine-protein phosphatase [Bifidobacteriaceae bacterium]|jgi:protein-tyrosine phosphatase|nr:tyrosine-protein phosphatase [Bifidobacteriaceae bacterium]